jgi:hypothetical protein
MILSDEQTRAASHGIGKGPTWEEIDRPVGPHPLPAWIRGAHVNWMDGYGNSPHVSIKTVGEEWPNPVFSQRGTAYVAEHPDGRLQIHFHDGTVGKHKIQVFRSLDGTIRQHRRYGPEWGDQPGLGTILNGVRSGHEPGEFVELEMRATTQQDGYAGRHFWLTMDDGEITVLRGPWRGGVPQGWTAITTIDCTKSNPWYVQRGLPWWKRGGCFGLELRDDVYIAALSHFLPHLPLARVTYSYGSYIEPFDPAWGEPKHFWLERQRAARVA